MTRRILAVSALALALSGCGSTFAGPPDPAPAQSTVAIDAPEPTCGPRVVGTPPCGEPVDPQADAKARFLRTLDANDVTRSVSGEAEYQIGLGACREIAKGTDPASLVDDLLKMGAAYGWSAEDAQTVVTASTEICP